MKELQCHHVLEPRNFPSLADKSDNLIVMCQTCHDEAPDEIRRKFAVRFYASLPSTPRERLLTFLERHASEQTDLINALKGGPLFAESAYWKRWQEKDGPNQASEVTARKLAEPQG